jgi:MoxR-like ATPase
LIDEINRAPAKTQAALFEVMEERQITYDGKKYPMSFPFLVIATQNPIEQEGTYNLPEAQLDRFLFKIKLDYPELHEEEEILHRYKNEIKSPSLDEIVAVFSADEIAKIQAAVSKVIVEDNLIKYIAAITHKTRNHGKIYLGGSPRASLSIIKSAKAIAAIRGRDFVTPEDIQFVAVHVLNHRIIMTPEAEMEGVSPEDVVQEIIKTLEVPR